MFVHYNWPYGAWRARISNEEVHRRTDQPSLTHINDPYHPPHVLRSHCMSIHLWITVEPLEPVWTLCQGTGTADRADHVTPMLQLLRTVESDLVPLIIGLATAYYRALVGTTTSSTGQAAR